MPPDHPPDSTMEYRLGLAEGAVKTLNERVQALEQWRVARDAQVNLMIGAMSLIGVANLVVAVVKT